MSLYDEIRNPFDDKTIIDVVQLYCNNDRFYHSITLDTKYDENNAIYYTRNFFNYILNPSCRRLYTYLQGKDPKKYDYNISKAIEKIKNRPGISEEFREYNIEYINAHYLYPISDYSSIFRNFKTYDDFLLYYNQNVRPYSEDLLRYVMLTRDYNPQIYPKYYQDLTAIKRRLNMSEQEINRKHKYEVFYRRLSFAFSGGANNMGFHVRQDFLEPGTKIKNTHNIKFYINAREDTYKFAAIYQKKCEELGIDYVFKVAKPTVDEKKRSDKLCIWSSYEDAEKQLNILRQIKKEHPEFHYDTPPILCGTIDDFIGIGQDFNGSYNKGMSGIIETAIKNYFGGMSKDIISKVIATNPHAINGLREEIKRLAVNNSLDGEKLCLTKKAKGKLETYNKTTTVYNLHDQSEKNKSMYEKTNAHVENMNRLDRKGQSSITKVEQDAIASKIKNDPLYDQYIDTLERYLRISHIPIYDYCLRVALAYKNHKESTLPAFEKSNPFINDITISLLAYSKDDHMPITFADILSKSIETILSQRRMNQGQNVVQFPDGPNQKM